MIRLDEIAIDNVCSRIDLLMDPMEDQRKLLQFKRIKDELIFETSDTYGYLKELYENRERIKSLSLKTKVTTTYNNYLKDKNSAENFYRVGPNYNRKPIQLDCILFEQYNSDVKRLIQNRWFELLDMLVNEDDLMEIFNCINRLKYKFL